jgi:predicted TPR repeat methyltransferase
VGDSGVSGTQAAENIIGETPEIWGRGYSTDSATVRHDYDAFAAGGRYDETFQDWGYVGPETAAAIMRNYVPIGSRILDAACGSGLTGTALRNLGYTRIEGIDISEPLLRLAEQTGAYERVTHADMQSFPLPFGDGEFDAVCFIGALTYFETNEILRQLCRIVRSGGHLVFSQRDDIMRDQNYAEKLAELERESLWTRTFGTEPMPYLPQHPQYATQIKVQYFVYRVV